MEHFLLHIISAIFSEGIDRFLCENFWEVVIVMVIVFIIALLFISKNPKV